MALASPSAAVKVSAPPPSMSKDTLSALTVEVPPEPEMPKPEPPKPEMPPPPPPEPELPKREVTPPPPEPDVKVGAFDAPAPNTPSAMPKAGVQTTGFDAPQAAAPDLKLQAAQTGLFGGGSAQARPGTDRRGSVATSGFEGGQVRQATTPAGGQVVSSGFGTGAPAAPAARPAGAVQPAGFGDTAATPPSTPASSASKLPVPPTPVEVLSKPTPTYTDEARAARIEGDVILEVVFAANRKVKVIRVVRGLGHGLDDMARAAAEKLTFTPATQAGEPVDVRATVTIVFRLT